MDKLGTAQRPLRVAVIGSGPSGFYAAEDTVSATFSFESGVMGTGSWCFIVSPEAEEDVIEISGTKGKVTFSCFQHVDVQLLTSDGLKNLSFQNPENISHFLIQQVVQELHGEGKCVSTGYSAARTSWVMEEIVKTYYA